MQPEDHVRMLHMVEAAEAALSFIAGHQRTDLDHDTMVLFAPLRRGSVAG